MVKILNHISLTFLFVGNQESPIKKKRISDVLERQESEAEEESEDSPMETSVPDSPTQCSVSVTQASVSLPPPVTTEEAVTAPADHDNDVDSSTSKRDASVAQRASHDSQDVNRHALANGECDVRLDATRSKIDKVIESNKDKRNSGGDKTVLISRNQAVNSKNVVKSTCSCSNSEKEKGLCNKCCSSKLSKPQTTADEPLIKPVVVLKPPPCRSTPDVLIQPASPAILAAHKRRVITVTLRQRSPSASPSPHPASRSASVSSSQPVSRSPSSCSTTSRASVASASSKHQLSNASSVCSFSPETLASIITVNGVTIADNEELSAEFASSLAVATNPSDDNKNSSDHTCKCDDQDTKSNIQSRSSIRNSHCNKIASYVHVNSPTPSVSPRPNHKSKQNTGKSIHTQSVLNRPRNSGTNKPSSNGGYSNNRLPTVSSSPSDCSSNGYYQCSPSVSSRNSLNTARTTNDSESCKNICSNSSVTSNSSGTLSYPCSSKSKLSTDNMSDTVILRNSCGNFSNLDSGSCGGCNCNGSKVKSSLNGSWRVNSNGNRHSSSSLDSGSCARSFAPHSRSRYGSECLGCEDKMEKVATKDEYSRSYSQPSTCCYSSAPKQRLTENGCCGDTVHSSEMSHMPESSV